VELPVVIAGGGIGGLATALGLSHAGVRTVVLERSAEFGEIGAGIQLGPNAFHAFDELGVGPAARDAAIYVERLQLMDAVSGDAVCHLSLDDVFVRRFGNPYAVMHRGDLLGILLNACLQDRQIELRAGAEVIDFTQDHRSVHVRLASGATVTGEALVGADGLRSRVRERVIGDGPPRLSGHTSFRSVIAVEQMPDARSWNAAVLWAGPGYHIVHYPLSGWRLFNLVATAANDASTVVAGRPVDAAAVLSQFPGLHGSVRAILERGSDWREWATSHREPRAGWVDGRVALLGDAAHPALQYLAQGACMALEDAVCLSECVRAAGNIAAALPEYERRRLVRTARVQLHSQALAEHVYHPTGVHAQVRNALMGAMSQAEWHEALAWLYDVRVSIAADN
jgi:salicylate hydroxylase